MIDDLDDDNIWRVNLFKVLGVSDLAEKKEIKQAYKALAKKYHPDRFPAKSKEQDEAKVKFSEISKAYDILTNETKRNQYLDTRRLLKDHLDDQSAMSPEPEKPAQAAPAPAPAPAPSASKKKPSQDDPRRQLAEDAFKESKVAFKKNDLDEMITLLKRAIELQPNNTKYHCELGLAYQKKGWEGMAQASFKQALVLDPKNQQAKKNYAGDKKEKKGGGFLSGLFSKRKK